MSLPQNHCTKASRGAMLRSSRGRVKGHLGSSFWFLVSSFWPGVYLWDAHTEIRSFGRRQQRWSPRFMVQLTAFPREEMFGLTSQLRRSAISIAWNMAEGQGRLSRREFQQFFGQARGSLIEMETQIVIAGNPGYLARETVAGLMGRSGEMSRLWHRLIQSMQPAEPPRTVQKLETGNQKPAPNLSPVLDYASVWLKTDVRAPCSGS
jgi:four helix bundle protein